MASYTCPKCGQSFTTLIRLTAHKLTHSSSRKGI